MRPHPDGAGLPPEISDPDVMRRREERKRLFEEQLRLPERRPPGRPCGRCPLLRGLPPGEVAH